MNDRQTKEFDATKECNFAIAPPGIGRFRVSAFVQQGLTGAVLRTINTKIPTIDELELPPILKEVVLSKRGLVHRGRRHRLGQVDHARRDGRLPQREDPRPHHHDRGPDRVRPPAQPLRRDAARGRRRHRELAHGAQEHAAPGARRDPDRRDPRPRDDGVRHPVRRDRPPGAGDAARQQRQPGARPHHQLLPGGAARAAADGPVAEHPRDDLAAADSARGRQGPHRRDGDHAATRR